MKTSPKWLQSFFDEPLPNSEELADALTFHSCEIEEITPQYLDVKVLPDRAGYCLCHRGVAYELSAILKMEMNDPLRVPVPTFEETKSVKVEVENGEKCPRYMGAFIKGVSVGPSPAWLKEALQSVGQRSVNNVVDATNYVMLDIGQPLHAFDAAHLQSVKGVYSIKVRDAAEGEKITTLTGEEFTLGAGTLLITDANTKAGIGIAGVKGGKAASITESTTDIILESASFEGSLIRKTSQKLKLWTDASQRYQNKPSPELTSYGMQAVITLIQQVAGGELEGVVDVYADEARTAGQMQHVTVTLTKINTVLGTQYTPAHVTNVFQSLGFAYLHEGDVFTVTPPFERRDILIAEDLIEEVGRILGYEHVAPVSLPMLNTTVDQSRFRSIEHIKDFLIGHGFTEISSQTFAKEGDIILENPLDQTRPALRTNLSTNMQDALSRAKTIAPRVLGPAHAVKLFEIGTVFTSDAEHLSLAVGYEQLVGKKSPAALDETVDQLQDLLPVITTSDMIRTDTVIEINLRQLDISGLSQNIEKDIPYEGSEYNPDRVHLGTYKPFSLYPFALRDVAVWADTNTEEDELRDVIVREAGDLLVRIDLFDTFEKKDSEGNAIRKSFAFRLVFESSERTLSDEDLSPLMEKITDALNSENEWEVR